MSSGDKMLASRKPVPFQGQVMVERPPGSINPEAVKSYLISNPVLLETLILENVSVSKLKELLEKKEERELETPVPIPLSPRKLIPVNGIDNKYKNDQIQEIVSNCLTEFAKLSCPFDILRQATQTIANVVKADSFTLYVPTHNDKDLDIYEANKTKTFYGPIGYNMTVAAHVATEQKSLLIKDLLQDTRFPKGINVGCDIYSVICIPLLLPEGDLVAISEFHRDGFKDIFSERDFQIANAMLTWILSCLHLSQINKVLESQQELNDFLLETTKQLFDDVISIDSLIQSIMHSTKNLVNAERCALFLIDHQSGELFADFFDEGYEEDGKPVFTKKKQIRLPFDEGIVSKVAKTGEIVNVKDALKDDRFTKNVDKQTGYTTRNVLCMPIVGKGGVIGVVELINSSVFDHFTKADESAFKMFAVYCALALHYSKLYSMLHLQQDQYEVAMEVLQYHIRASDEEISELMKNPLPKPDQIPPSLNMFDFYGGDFMDKLPTFFLHMIDDLFGVSRFQVEKLVHFILTVKKNYRHVMYHNWKHGFHVAHSLYMMIKTSPGVFTTVESLALVLAGVCHDLDHRGFNNNFFQKLHLPLAALYSTSVMEQHHYKQTVMILQSQGHDILSGMSKKEYKVILEMIRQAIIATDLGLYFDNQKLLSGYLKDGVFDINNPDMRNHALSLIMTGADLCAVAKPWNTQKETVNEIYEEFYYQGDVEKKKGFVPIPMMDRDKKDLIPQQQVGFIKFICCPLYTTLKQILPSTEKLLEGSVTNAELWQNEADKFEEQKKESANIE